MKAALLAWTRRESGAKIPSNWSGASRPLAREVNPPEVEGASGLWTGVSVGLREGGEWRDAVGPRATLSAPLSCSLSGLTYSAHIFAESPEFPSAMIPLRNGTLRTCSTMASIEMRAMLHLMFTSCSSRQHRSITSVVNDSRHHNGQLSRTARHRRNPRQRTSPCTEAKADHFGCPGDN